MNYLLELEGRIPPKKNSKQVFKARNGKTLLTASKSYKEWHYKSMFAISKQKKDIELKEVVKQAKIKINYTFGDRIKRDITNITESVMDLLVDTNIIIDDNYLVISELQLKAEYKKGEFKCKIEIIKLE